MDRPTGQLQAALVTASIIPLRTAVVGPLEQQPEQLLVEPLAALRLVEQLEEQQVGQLAVQQATVWPL